MNEDQDWPHGYIEEIDGVTLRDSWGLDDTIDYIEFQAPELRKDIACYSLEDAKTVLQWREKAKKYDEACQAIGEAALKLLDTDTSRHVEDRRHE